MRKKTKKVTSRHKKLNCIDCGVLIDSELSAHIEMSKKDLDMPNMLVFCINLNLKIVCVESGMDLNICLSRGIKTHHKVVFRYNCVGQN